MNAPNEHVKIGPAVYSAISAVQAEMALKGIAKDRKNTQGSGYNFRGIDDCYNAIAPLMAKHGLCMLPRMLSRETSERTTTKGGLLIYSVVHAEFDFVSAADGSKHTVSTFGEAMDSGDKSTNKAMSAAQKYAILQTFVVPTEGDNDTENTTHDVAAGMTPQAVADHLAAIEAADTVEALKRAWVSAEQIAKVGADVDSYKRFKAAMQKRYEILKQEEPA